MKTCSKCKVEKPLDAFNKRKRAKDGLKSACKDCLRAQGIEYYYRTADQSREYRKQNAERERARAKAYYQANKEYCRERNKRWSEENAERMKEWFSQYYQDNKGIKADWQREYRDKNREAVAATYRNWKHRKRKEDPYFVLVERLRARLALALKGKSIKSARTMDLVGCDRPELLAYIESKFVKGMTWENRDKWHLDHILPVAAFDLTNPEEQKVCFHYTNLQPLWAEDNQRKSARIEEPIQMHLPL